MRQLWLALVCVAWPALAPAEIYHSRESALRLAFGEQHEVQVRDLFLTESEAQEVSARSGLEVPPGLFSAYVGSRGGELIGYAYFDTHTVRTLPETILVVLTPTGDVAETHLLAFHEPAEYEPPERWLRQFDDSVLDDQLWLERDIVGIAGSTLSARAVTAAVRKILTIHALEISAGQTP